MFSQTPHILYTVHNSLQMNCVDQEQEHKHFLFKTSTNIHKPKAENATYAQTRLQQLQFIKSVMTDLKTCICHSACCFDGGVMKPHKPCLVISYTLKHSTQFHQAPIYASEQQCKPLSVLLVCLKCVPPSNWAIYSLTTSPLSSALT